MLGKLGPFGIAKSTTSIRCLVGRRAVRSLASRKALVELLPWLWKKLNQQAAAAEPHQQPGDHAAVSPYAFGLSEYRDGTARLPHVGPACDWAFCVRPMI
jgi:hypothetical protein